VVTRWRCDCGELGLGINDRGAHESINGFHHWSSILQTVQNLRSFFWVGYVHSQRFFKELTREVFDIARQRQITRRSRRGLDGSLVKLFYFIFKKIRFHDKGWVSLLEQVPISEQMYLYSLLDSIML
jgi:hypothetical protein